MKITLPYNKGTISTEIEEVKFKGFIVPEADEFLEESYKKTEEELVQDSLDHPIGTPKLSELSEGKKKVVVISSDHTRPVPPGIMMPLILKEIRKGNPDADITILIATGTHRATTAEELLTKYGEKIVDNEKIVIHDSRDKDNLINIGTLPSGASCTINKMVVEADLLVAEGFIEPHFFAGYSGGRKAVFPGVAGYESVVGNHNGQFIDSNKARTGNLINNPIHNDMVEASKLANLAFIINVVLDHDKRIVKCVSGHPVEAHLEGTNFVDQMMSAKPIVTDITITSNGGYPLDQNIYQTVKGMTAAEATNRQDGVIIIASASIDGHGGEGFYQTFKNCEKISDIYTDAVATPANETIPDQWQSQILARVMMNHHVIYVSDIVDPTIVTDMKLSHAMNLEEALEKAYALVGQEASVAVIPDGVSTIIKK